MVQVKAGGTRRLAGLGALCVAAAAIVGCGSAPPVPRDRYYALEPEVRIAPARLPIPAILQVNDLSARGFLGGRQILFRTEAQPLVVDRYDLYLWDEPVPRALSAALAGAIRNAGVFKHVVISADRARADLLLGGEIVRFEHRPTHEPPQVLATANLSLVRTDDRRSLWTREYSAAEPVAGDTPEAMAEAFNRVAGRIAADVVRDLEALRPQLSAVP